MFHKTIIFSQPFRKNGLRANPLLSSNQPRSFLGGMFWKATNVFVFEILAVMFRSGTWGVWRFSRSEHAFLPSPKEIEGWPVSFPGGNVGFQGKISAAQGDNDCFQRETMLFQGGNRGFQGKIAAAQGNDDGFQGKTMPSEWCSMEKTRFSRGKTRFSRENPRFSREKHDFQRGKHNFQGKIREGGAGEAAAAAEGGVNHLKIPRFGQSLRNDLSVRPKRALRSISELGWVPPQTRVFLRGRGTSLERVKNRQKMKKIEDFP